MSKELEALEKLKQNSKDDTHLFDDELFDIIEPALKALEIIKEKKVFIEELLQSDSLEEYNDYVEEQGRYDKDKLIQEEFDLLKEVLL